MFEMLFFNKVSVAAPPTSEYFGEVPTANFIDGASLAAALSFTNGTSVFNTEPWFKVKHNGKTLYFPKKPIRHTVSWNQLNTANLVYGNRTVLIGGLTYKVRLFTGSTGDPAPLISSNPAPGGEWDALFYKLWSGNPNGTAENWANYTTAELGQDSTARFNWCQETSSAGATLAVIRGNTTPANAVDTSKSNSSANYGWRPILELVE